MRSRLTIFVPAGVLFVSAVLAAAQQQPSPAQSAPGVVRATVEFADVQPILRGSCYACHSGERPMAQLRLDVRSMALRGGLSGAAILPGNSKDSPLIHRVLGTGGTRMPFGAAPLTQDQIDILARWIDAGAPWPDALANESNAAIRQHWAYVKPVRPALPGVQNAAWVRNPIDAFVLARLEKENLIPSPEASKETLIRRVSLDLIGLPPTPSEIDAFVNDTRSDAYERLVERLLASPHYGERWATPWLDLARYGDSDGYDKDLPRVQWPYRDWVIKAFNDNKPFDRFTIEQLAGDLLPNATVDQRVATGFVRSSLLNSEGGTDPEEQNWVAQVDRASTIGTAFLGSTVGCAQCHNHKYDPFKQTDFYGLVAFFNNAAFVPGRGNQPSYREPTLELPTPEQAVARDAINKEIGQIQDRMNNWPGADTLQAAWEKSILDAEAAWRPLMPTRLESTRNTTLTVDEAGAILASGRTPDSDTYIVEAKTPVAGRITALRLEALPHASLPMGGPGRDYYGNFAVQSIQVEHGPSSDRLTPVAVAETTLTDSPTVLTNDTVIRISLRQLWRAQVGGVERLPRQLILSPEQPFTLEANSVIRVKVVQQSDIASQILGHFRLSVTTDGEPGRVVAIPYNLRPVLRIPVDQRKPEQQQAVSQQWRNVAPELAQLRDRIAPCGALDDDDETAGTGKCGDLRRRLMELKIPTTLVLAENPSVTHPSTQLRERGDFTKKGAEVKAGVPSFLGALPTDAPPNRLGLATWLVSRDNPLTARVRINQIWQVYFGRGLVETTEDFGSQGTPPSHPELLDWLAIEFMERGWDQRAMHRLIVTSNTYRQSSKVLRDLLEKDPRNTLLARGARFRGEAEMVRDIVLAASGLLSTKIGGAPVMPYQPDGLWLFHTQKADDKWILSEGEDRHRRALYTYVRRTARYPSLVVFDASSHENVTARRPTTNTPLQALTTLNDPAFFEAAQAMARRIMREGGAEVAAKAAYGYRLATAHTPDASTLRQFVQAFERESAYFARTPQEATGIAGEPNPALAAWTMVANALLNLDQTLTKE